MAALSLSSHTHQRKVVEADLSRHTHQRERAIPTRESEGERERERETASERARGVARETTATSVQGPSV